MVNEQRTAQQTITTKAIEYQIKKAKKTFTVVDGNPEETRHLRHLLEECSKFVALPLKTQPLRDDLREIGTTTDDNVLEHVWRRATSSSL